MEIRSKLERSIKFTISELAEPAVQEAEPAGQEAVAAIQKEAIQATIKEAIR